MGSSHSDTSHEDTHVTETHTTTYTGRRRGISSLLDSDDSSDSDASHNNWHSINSANRLPGLIAVSFSIVLMCYFFAFSIFKK